MVNNSVLKVLFIEDDPTTQEVLSRAVNLLGHQGQAAFSARQALASLDAGQPDLIFVDIQLADMHGLDLVRLLRQHPQTTHTPLIMLSASAELDLPQAARAAGADDYLQKPLRLHVLEEIIQKYAPHTTQRTPKI